MAAMTSALPETVTVLLEDTWEAEDIKEECLRLNINCNELTVAELENMNASDFVETTYCCNTELVQRKLKEVGCSHKVPSTYPRSLHRLLRRTVHQTTLGDINLSELPLFIKPVSNDKNFDGRVVKNIDGFERVVEDAQEDMQCPVWVVEKVSFLVEHRLFVGGGKLYGMGRIQGSCDAIPPEQFVDEVLSCCGSEVFWAVDVGLISRSQGDNHNDRNNHEEVVEDNKFWVVVEVNPPFSLDDHGLEIEPYLRYCRDACEWIRK